MDLSQISSILGGDIGASYVYHPRGITSLQKEQLDKVRKYIDSRHSDLVSLSGPDIDENTATQDFKVALSMSSLADLIGQEAAHELSALFGGNYDEILIRRCESHGNHINFHVDFSRKTLQVALNGDDEYVGGKLAFIRNGALEIPYRPAGSITIHEGGIVHGVTELQSGVRYGLFLLQKQDASGRRGNAWSKQ